ncbi:isoprenylcysteine carboxylmethyltransferase family protein [Candidatus Woesearchaeota archaeon]|nr:isoprenylcysteine carboxylmethyltransferase family protein [Candidatus Woesearchaeota archaeon]
MSVANRLVAFVNEKSVQSSGKNNAAKAFAGIAIVSAAMALIAYAALRLDAFLGLPKIMPGSLAWVGMAAALPFILSGLFLSLWCVKFFIKAKGTPIPLSPPKKLVTSGPYAFSRNPMITGYFAVLLGLCFLLRSLALLAILAPLFVLALTAWVKAVEEPELEKRFGNAYTKYRKMVPMFFPKLKL